MCGEQHLRDVGNESVTFLLFSFSSSFEDCCVVLTGGPNVVYNAGCTNARPLWSTYGKQLIETSPQSRDRVWKGKRLFLSLSPADPDPRLPTPTH